MSQADLVLREIEKTTEKKFLPIFAESMKNYLDYVRSSEKYQSRYVPMGEDGLEISVKK